MSSLRQERGRETEIKVYLKYVQTAAHIGCSHTPS